MSSSSFRKGAFINGFLHVGLMDGLLVRRAVARPGASLEQRATARLGRVQQHVGRPTPIGTSGCSCETPRIGIPRDTPKSPYLPRSQRPEPPSPGPRHSASLPV